MGNIFIVTNNGQIYTSITSNSQSKLRLLPNWGSNIALIDGNRLFLFPYDEHNTYWTNSYGTDWDFPLVNPNTFPRKSKTLLNTSIFYNYPNLLGIILQLLGFSIVLVLLVLKFIFITLRDY